MYSFWDWRGHALTLAVIVGTVGLVFVLGLLPGWLWAILGIGIVATFAYLLVWYAVVNETF